MKDSVRKVNSYSPSSLVKVVPAEVAEAFERIEELSSRYSWGFNELVVGRFIAFQSVLPSWFLKSPWTESLIVCESLMMTAIVGGLDGWAWERSTTSKWCHLQKTPGWIEWNKGLRAQAHHHGQFGKRSPNWCSSVDEQEIPAEEACWSVGYQHHMAEFISAGVVFNHSSRKGFKIIEKRFELRRIVQLRRSRQSL